MNNTDELDNKILEQIQEGIVYKKIAEELGISPSSIAKRVKKMKDKGVRIPEKNEKKDKEILELLKNGLSQREISKRIEISEEMISKRIKRMKENGIVIPEKIKRRKFENDQVDNKILELMEKGLNKSEIANSLNLSRQSISDRTRKMKERGVIIPEKNKIPENELLELIEKGLTQVEIAEKYNVSKSFVSIRIKRMKENGIKVQKLIKIKRSRKLANDEKDDEILKLIDKGLNQKEIGKELGITNISVSRRLKRMKDRGVEVPKSKCYNKPKKTENDERDNKILELLNKGFIQKKIGIELGISKIAVTKRIKRMKDRGVEIPKKKKVEVLKNTEANIAKNIVNLMNTKNATIEQVKIMAKHYGVDKQVEELLNSLDEKER